MTDKMDNATAAPHARPKAAGVGDYLYKGTNIDRRGMARTVPMEVLCLGRERTGTSSLREALFMLGYSHVYHMAAVLHENPKDAELWCEAFDHKLYNKGTFGRKEWDSLLGHCMATTDMPGSLFPAELTEAYPKAKVILTVRDTSRAWKDSIMDTTYKLAVASYPGDNLNVFQRLWWWLLPRPPYFNMLEKMGEGTAYFTNPQGIEAEYLRHNEEVRKLAKDRDMPFLEFNVKEGWAPLCKFLDKPIPDAPFPRVNEKAVFQQNTKRLKLLQTIGVIANGFLYLGLPFTAVAGMFLAYKYHYLEALGLH